LSPSPPGRNTQKGKGREMGGREGGEKDGRERKTNDD